MASRFNTLYLGQPSEAADELEGGQEETTVDELRIALINALRRIDALQTDVQTLGSMTRG